MHNIKFCSKLIHIFFLKWHRRSSLLHKIYLINDEYIYIVSREKYTYVTVILNITSEKMYYLEGLTRFVSQLSTKNSETLLSTTERWKI